MELTDEEFDELLTYSTNYDLAELLDFIEGEKQLFHVSAYNPRSDNDILQYFTGLGFDIKLEPLPDSEYYRLYVAENESVLDEAVGASPQDTLPELLGYPSCCVETFSTNVEQDRILRKIQSVEEYPFYMNRLSRTYAILSHFPCQFDCEDSMEIGERRYELLKSKDPQTAARFKDKLSAFYVYISERGLYEAQAYTTEENEDGDLTVSYYRFDAVQPLNTRTIIPEPDISLLDTLNQTDELTVKSHNHIRTDVIDIESPSLRVAMFS